MITKRSARIIRAGIMSKCLPVWTYKMSHGSSGTMTDAYMRARYLAEWDKFKDHPLAQKASDRTGEWVLWSGGYVE